MTPEALVRTFPFTVRPRHRETVDSYTRRTLAANGEPEALRRELLSLAGDGTTWETILTAKVRRDLTHLLEPASSSRHGADVCGRCDSLLRDRWACMLCSHGESIEERPHLESFICERHHRWTGPGSTPGAQPSVSARDVKAHRAFRKLRLRGRMDLQTLTDVITGLSEDRNADDHGVFATAVEVVRWLTRKDTLRRLFDPAVPHSESFEWARDAIENAIGVPAPATVRAVWLRLWPAHVALNSAFRGYSGYHAGHIHDFPLPADITSWYPHPTLLQSNREYLACTGDDGLTAFIPRCGGPTVLAPRTRHTFCRAGHRYLEVVTSASDDERERTPCPACTGHHVQHGINDLATVAPEVATQLHPTLNGDLCATDITARSSQRVWWLCSEGHPYRATPSNRTLTDSGCAVCLGRVILVGVNDFATTHPVVARDLHPSNWKRAHQLTAKDPKPRRWLCSEGHEYRSSVKKRVTTRGTCPECQKERARRSGRNLTNTHPELG